MVLRKYTVVENLPAIQETLVQSLGQEGPLEGNGNPLQYSCLENLTDRGVWHAMVHGVVRIGRDISLWQRYIQGIWKHMKRDPKPHWLRHLEGALHSL